MGYQKTNWLDNVKAGNGTVIQVGTPVNAANLNKIEQGIADATGIVNYTSSKAYVVNDVTIFDGKIYRCKTNHTAPATFNQTYWDVIGGSANIRNFQASQNYTINEITFYGGKLYRSKATFVAAATFNPTDWEPVAGSSSTNDFQPNTYYNKNDVVIYDRVMYRAKANFTSGATFNATNFENVGGSGTKIFSQSTQPTDEESKIGDLWIIL